MPELKPLKSGYYIWHYVPSVPLSAISLVLWLAIGGLLAWKMVKTRAWFSMCVVIGCLMEVIGYGTRATAANKTDKLMPYCIQAALILLPPVLFAATIYMCLGRVIRLVHADHLSFVKPARLTKVFVTCDIISFLVQGNSTPFTVMADKNRIFPILGQALVLLGLAIQLIAFCVFALTALNFHRRLRAAPTERSYQVDISWVKVMYMLYITSALIILRSVFRIIEFAMGNDGYLLTREWPLYVFDTIPMLAVCIVFFAWFPTCLAGVKTKGTDGVELESQTSGQGFINKH